MPSSVSVCFSLDSEGGKTLLVRKTPRNLPSNPETPCPVGFVQPSRKLAGTVMSHTAPGIHTMGTGTTKTSPPSSESGSHGASGPRERFEVSFFRSNVDFRADATGEV
jgi:hypothetical protein